MRTIHDEAATVAADRERTTAFRQLRRDMRYIARVLRRYDATPQGPDWDTAYAYKWDCERRLELRYGRETLFRMKQIVIRTYRLSKIGA